MPGVETIQSAKVVNVVVAFVAVGDRLGNFFKANFARDAAVLVTAVGQRGAGLAGFVYAHKRYGD